MDYNGHYYNIGETFDATDNDAKILTTLGEAEAVDEEITKPAAYSRKDLRARP